MAARVQFGCCGWSYLNERDFPELLDPQSKRSKLQSYARLFGTVEIKSTFYRLPHLSTAEKWRKEADGGNPEFESTVKAFKGIPHLHRFQKKASLSLDSYRALREICSCLGARFVLFQSPASFKPSKENINTMTEFFDKIDRQGIVAV